MARMFVTSFHPVSQNIIGVYGFYHDVATGIYTGVEVDSIPYDPTSSTSVRQQALDNLVPAVNARLVELNITAAPLIASDVEIVS